MLEMQLLRLLHLQLVHDRSEVVVQELLQQCVCLCTQIQKHIALEIYLSVYSSVCLQYVLYGRWIDLSMDG